MPRGTCLDCVRKHLSQAAALMDEAALGYPRHRWYAVGHLAEAESESRNEYPQFSIQIRKARLQIMNKSGEPNFDKLLGQACLLAGDSEDLTDDPANSKGFEPVVDTHIPELVEVVRSKGNGHL